MCRTAIIIGASGLVGKEVLKQLLIDSDTTKKIISGKSICSSENNTETNSIFSKIIIFVREPIALTHEKLEQHVINFDAIEDYCNLIKGNIVFCCLGTTIKKALSRDAFLKVDYTYPLELAKIAKKNGVKSFLIISSVGANTHSSNFYLKVKGDVEAALEKIDFTSLIVMRPSLLLGDRNEFRFGELAFKVLMKFFSFAFVGKLRKYRAIESVVVAKAMVRLSILSMNKASVSKLSGLNIFQSDSIAELGKD